MFFLFNAFIIHTAGGRKRKAESQDKSDDDSVSIKREKAEKQSIESGSQNGLFLSQIFNL